MPEIPTLEIDMDKECERCSEKGATNGGLCLKCIARSFKGVSIGYVTIRQTQAEICAMLVEYADEIDKAYTKADGDLTIAFGVKMAGTRMSGEVELTVTINFVESRIKHSVKVKVNEKQRKIPGLD